VPGSCHAGGAGLYVLPDPRCTPGAVNPNVTQANIGSTICKSGWTATVRPPESYTEPLKEQQLGAYGLPGPVSNYEEDHLIPLELGGSPAGPANLWPERGGSPNPKDAVENAGREAVCAGRIPLAVAQRAIAADWITFGEQLGVTHPPAGPTASTAPASPAPPAPTPATTAAPASASCTPRTNAGECYEPGEFCRASDHGRTGVDGRGQSITCEQQGSRWYWELTA